MAFHKVDGTKKEIKAVMKQLQRDKRIEIVNGPTVKQKYKRDKDTKLMLPTKYYKLFVEVKYPAKKGGRK